MSTELVHKLINANKNAIIAIDGELGAGKTTFAKDLSKLHSFSCIHLDDYLEKGQGMFVDALKFGELRAAIRNEHPPFIIEGVCLLNVLKRLRIGSSAIFVGKNHL